MAWGNSKLDRWFLSIPGGIVLVLIGVGFYLWQQQFPLKTSFWEWFFILLGAIIIVKNLVERNK